MARRGHPHPHGLGCAELSRGLLTSLLSVLLSVLLAFPGTVLAACSLYLLVLAIAGLTRREHSPRALPRPAMRLLVLVPAHDEVRLVGRCVASLVAQEYPRELMRVLVIADNCSDATAARAAEAGAEVVVRHEPDAPGKG